MPKCEFNDNINRLVSFTKKFLKENQNLILIRVDKGNITVTFDKDQYLNKMENLLSDTNTYNAITKNPIKKLTSRLRDMLTRWKNSNFISTYRSLYCSDGVLPRTYGLSKINKSACPFRLIVSFLKRLLYHLASFLHRIIHKSFPLTFSHVSNSFELVKKLFNIYTLVITSI